MAALHIAMTNTSLASTSGSARSHCSTNQRHQGFTVSLPAAGSLQRCHNRNAWHSCSRSSVVRYAGTGEAGDRTKLNLRITDAEEEGKEVCPPGGCLEDLLAGDIMTSPAISVKPDVGIFDAMDVLVENNVSGMPVVDDDNTVIGVISGYDLLALESTPGRLEDNVGFFPPVDRCKTLYDGNQGAMWSDFRDLQQRLKKAKGNTVGEAMHDTVTITEATPLQDAANLIVRRKLHRLIVVDENNKLQGVVSRGDILRATMNNMRFAMEMEKAAAAEEGALGASA